MAKKFYTLFVLLSFLAGHSQVSTKLDLHLYNRLSQGKMNGGNISLLVKGDPEKVKALTKKMGGFYKYSHGTISSVSIPEKNVIAFSNDLAVKKIQSTFGKGIALMDTARIRNNIDSAQTGYAPLPDSMVGKGVLIGIIDGGIYWQHADFKNADGTTRIKYIWDQSVDSIGSPPLGFNYGVQWAAADLDNGTCTEVEANGRSNHCPSDFSHGTCVAGIAAGNGLSGRGNPLLGGKFTGVAPQSDLIVVNLGTGACAPNQGNDFLSQISDAVDYIFKTASALGMPCVINISQGTYYGSHDGVDLTSEMIDSMVIEPTLPSTPPNQRFGRVVVAAAGNAGNVPMHLSYTVPSDSTAPAFTFFNYSGGEVYFDLWADTASFNKVWFTVGCNSNTGADLGHIGYYNVPANFSPLVDGTGNQRSQTLYNGVTPLGGVEMQVTLDSGRYHVEFIVPSVNSASDLWRLQMYATNSTSTFDLWASSAYIGSSDIISTIGGNTIQYPHYQLPDTLKTLVSSWQCSDYVITVGNYSNRAGYLDYDSVTQLAGGTDGQILANSSVGPTRDNRLKPDISATGTTIICTGDSIDIAVTVGAGNAYKCAYGGKDIRNGGTSMSSPIVAGIVALYFQKRPTAGYAEVKKVLECTATRDSFTGPNANIQYGYGKVNAYQALINTTCVTLGTMDSNCVNYNPLATIDTGGCVAKIYGNTDTACINYSSTANVDTGHCVAKIYGCTDPNANNYDSLANVDNGGCNYTSVAKTIAGISISLRVMPNPFSGQTTFSFRNNGYDFTVGEIDVTNVIGEQMDKLSIGQNSADYIYDAQKLAGGIYFYSLKLDNKVVKSGKLIVE